MEHIWRPIMTWYQSPVQEIRSNYTKLRKWQVFTLNNQNYNQKILNEFVTPRHYKYLKMVPKLKKKIMKKERFANKNWQSSWWWVNRVKNDDGFQWVMNQWDDNGVNMNEQNSIPVVSIGYNLRRCCITAAPRTR